MSMGKSSSLPISMSKIKTHLEKSVKKEKFAVGPTIERPGPTLLNVVATAVNEVVRSCPSIETSRTDKAISNV